VDSPPTGPREAKAIVAPGGGNRPLITRSEREPRHARRSKQGLVIAAWLLVAAVSGASLSAGAHILWLGTDVPESRGSVGLHTVSPGSTPPPGKTAPATENASTRDAIRSAFLADLLDRRARALLHRDPAAWLNEVEPAVRKTAAERFTRMAHLPWTALRYDVLAGDVTPTEALQSRWGPSVWSARVSFSYRLPGDTRDVERRRIVTIRPIGSAWRLVSDVPAEGPRDLWDVSDVRVVRGQRSLVIGSNRMSDLASYALQADNAAVKVDGAWGTDWTRTLTVVVPQDAGSMAKVLGRDSVAGLDQIAAVTTGELDRRSQDGGASTPATGRQPATADRIVVNPGAFAGFTAPERRIVLTHEATHVAVRATSRASTPIWLEEGFADFVAYTGSGLTRQSIAADLLARARSGETPSRLPKDSDFDPARGQVAPAYAGAWMALDLIERQHGRSAVVRFARIANGLEHPPVRSGAADTPLGTAFRTIMHEDQPAFEAQWVAAVNQAAGRG
jgi:hypothetical protein